MLSRRISFIATLLVLLMAATAFGQSREQLKQQAEQALQTMTPDQIDAKLKELGISRSEAESRAKDLGIDIGSYLARKSAAATAAPAAAILPPDTTQPAPPPVVHVKKDLTGPNGLKYFGYDVFLTVPPAFEPTAVGPVDPEYLLGPGDVLRLSVWGQVEFQYDLPIDNEGKVFIPTIGQVVLTGMTLDHANAQLRKILSRSYAGLVTQPPKVWLDVTLANLRPKRIFLMGEVEKPGGYTVNSYSTVFSALYSVGGPTVRGSLRDVRVIRNGKQITSVDLYDYLTGASTTNDIRVQSNDIIFVPARGKTVSISGEIRTPAIYELKEREGIEQLVHFAGGVLVTGFAEKVTIDRIVPPSQRKGVEDRIVLQIDLQKELQKGTKGIVLYDGDEMKIPSILDEKRNYVVIDGAVWRPGRFELGKVNTVRELITAAGGLHPKARMISAQLVRLNEDRITRSVIEFDLGALMDGGRDIVLQPQDAVSIFSEEVTEILPRSVTIDGAVRQPGRYELQDSMTVEDLILQAGGFTEGADPRFADLTRMPLKGLKGDSLASLTKVALDTSIYPAWAKVTPLEPGKALLPPRHLLGHGDRVYVRLNPDYKPQHTVHLGGEVRFPGNYTLLTRNERLSELLDRAGGLTSFAYLPAGRMLRKGERVNVDFPKAFTERDKDYDIVLHPADSIYIPGKPNAVRVVGEVYNPGMVAYVPGLSMWDYVNYSGGLTDSAQYVLLMNANGNVEKFGTGWFKRIFQSDPAVKDGATITVTRMPPPPPESPVDIGGTIKDIFAITASAVTIMVLASQVK